MPTAETSIQLTPATVVFDTSAPDPLPIATSAIPKKAAASPLHCNGVTACLNRTAASMTIKIGMVAERIVATEADVLWTPNDWATLPRVIPITPRPMMLGMAFLGTRSSRRARNIKSGTATEKRRAVKVMGGMFPRPSFVMGIERPQISASKTIAAKLFVERKPDGANGCDKAAVSVCSCDIFEAVRLIGVCVHALCKAGFAHLTNHLFSQDA